MQKDNKKILFFMFMVGLFMMLGGVISIIISPEITDLPILFTGFVLTGVSAYKLFIK